MRDYGVDGQLGLEPTFEEYINKLCNIFDEVKRVLRDDGTCWVNIGDTYYGSGKGVETDPEKCKESVVMSKEWKRPSREEFTKAGIKKNCLICDKEFLGKENSQFCSRECLNKKGNDFRSQNRLLPDKCLTMIPQRFAIEMVNRGWILRNTIIWHKPNCMPSSVKDRFTVDFEYVFFFTKSKKYWFETQYEPHTTKENRPDGIVREREFGYDTQYPEVRGFKTKPNVKQPQTPQKHGLDINYGKQGRNKRTVWTINPKPFKEAHFAVYPEELCETPLKAGCPEFVCVKCGKPKRQVLKLGKNYGFNFRVRDVQKGRIKYDDRKASEKEIEKYKEGEMKRETNQIIISEGCNCNAEFTGGIVLDPFFGAGTTGLVALKQNKKFIGIELNKEYIEIANKRLKPFLEQSKLN